jgi:hypothetical protein
MNPGVALVLSTNAARGKALVPGHLIQSSDLTLPGAAEAQTIAVASKPSGICGMKKPAPYSCKHYQRRHACSAWFDFSIARNICLSCLTGDPRRSTPISKKRDIPYSVRFADPM